MDVRGSGGHTKSYVLLFIGQEKSDLVSKMLGKSQEIL